MPWPYTHLKIWLCEADQHKNTNLKLKLFSDVKGLWYKFYKLQIDFFIKACNASISISKQQQQKKIQSTHTRKSVYFILYQVFKVFSLFVKLKISWICLCWISPRNQLLIQKRNAKKLIMILKVNLTTARRLMYL